MSIQELETAVTRLPKEELATFWRWFEEYFADEWDRQIEADALSGRFDVPWSEADQKYDNCRTECQRVQGEAGGGRDLRTSPDEFVRCKWNEMPSARRLHAQASSLIRRSVGPDFRVAGRQRISAVIWCGRTKLLTAK